MTTKDYIAAQQILDTYNVAIQKLITDSKINIDDLSFEEYLAMGADCMLKTVDVILEKCPIVETLIKRTHNNNI